MTHSDHIVPVSRSFGLFHSIPGSFLLKIRKLELYTRIFFNALSSKSLYGHNKSPFWQDTKIPKIHHLSHQLLGLWVEQHHKTNFHSNSGKFHLSYLPSFQEPPKKPPTPNKNPSETNRPRTLFFGAPGTSDVVSSSTEGGGLSAASGVGESPMLTAGQGKLQAFLYAKKSNEETERLP